MTREIPTFITPSFAQREVDRNLEERGMRSPAAVPQWRNDRFVEFLMCEVFLLIIFYLFVRKIFSGVARVISPSPARRSALRATVAICESGRCGYSIAR